MVEDPDERLRIEEDETQEEIKKSTKYTKRSLSEDREDDCQKRVKKEKTQESRRREIGRAKLINNVGHKGIAVKKRPETNESD